MRLATSSLATPEVAGSSPHVPIGAVLPLLASQPIVFVSGADDKGDARRQRRCTQLLGDICYYLRYHADPKKGAWCLPKSLYRACYKALSANDDTFDTIGENNKLKNFFDPNIVRLRASNLIGEK